MDSSCLDNMVIVLAMAIILMMPLGCCACNKPFSWLHHSHTVHDFHFPVYYPWHTTLTQIYLMLSFRYVYATLSRHILSVYFRLMIRYVSRLSLIYGWLITGVFPHQRIRNITDTVLYPSELGEQNRDFVKALSRWLVTGKLGDMIERKFGLYIHWTTISNISGTL